MPIPLREHEVEISIRKSRFVARAGPPDTRGAAMALLERMRQRYPDARHHCWAYLLGQPESASSAATSDDGEPGGTAGKPILNVIQHKGLGDVMVVVSRYFGGIKLGAGGLVRAYAGATEAVLSELPTAAPQPRTAVTLRLDFPREQALRHWAQVHDAEILAVHYGEQVGMRLLVPDTKLSDLDTFCAALRDVRRMEC